MSKRSSVISSLKSAAKMVVNFKSPDRQLLYSQINMYGKTVVGVDKNKKIKVMKPKKVNRLERIYRRG